MNDLGEDGTRLVDGFGRIARSLRVSVTDRCNLRCQYCVPACAEAVAARPDCFDPAGFATVARVAVRLGIHHVRLTGGEPLVRSDLPEIVRMLKRDAGVSEVALTTNGMLLESRAESLARAGLDRVTVSVDSLDAMRFTEITRGGRLDTVWRGIHAAQATGLAPVKVNVVVQRGINDDEFDSWIRLAAEQPLGVRFLELMPIGEMAEDYSRAVNLSEIRQLLIERHGLVKVAGPGGNGPARYYQQPGALGTIGFITPVSDHVCDVCSRLRLTAEGGLRACLASDQQLDLRDAVRQRDEGAIEAAFRHVVAHKPRGHQWTQGAVTLTRMKVLGG